MKNFNDLHISTELKQQLKLTPEMRLRLEVLAATHLELKDLLNRELEENPIVDDIIEQEDTPEIKKDSGGKSEETGELELGKGEEHIDEIMSEEYSENIYGSADYIPSNTEKENPPELGEIREYSINSLAAGETDPVRSGLMEQLNSLEISEELYLAAYKIISFVNDDGFIPYEPAELAEALNIKIDLVEKAIEIIKSFEPTGTGAKDSREALLMQLKEKKMRDSLAYLIVEGYYEEFLRQQYDKIASALKTSQENINKAAETIKTLNPYPCRAISEKKTEFMKPDIIVEEDESGEYKVRVLGELPEIKINSRLLKDYKENPETKAFVKRYEERIRTLLAAWEERNKTIKKVVEKIIGIQKDYLKNDKMEDLKPLTLKDIADEIGMHESTISRIVSRKSIQMPSGVYPLKNFFSSKLSTSSGEDVSSNSVREKIREMIESEDPSNPLTDTDIESRLKEAGIKIARRTVTKYREKMGIPAANLRKK